MIRIMQCNLRRMSKGRQLLAQAARESKADNLLISEQPRGPVDDNRRLSSNDSLVQIVLTDTARLVAIASFSGRGYVGVSTGELLLVSCYLPPGLAIDQYYSLLG